MMATKRRGSKGLEEEEGPASKSRAGRMTRASAAASRPKGRAGRRPVTDDSDEDSGDSEEEEEEEEEDKNEGEVVVLDEDGASEGGVEDEEDEEVSNEEESSEKDEDDEDVGDDEDRERGSRRRQRLREASQKRGPAGGKALAGSSLGPGDPPSAKGEAAKGAAAKRSRAKMPSDRRPSKAKARQSGGARPQRDTADMISILSSSSDDDGGMEDGGGEEEEQVRVTGRRGALQAHASSPLGSDDGRAVAVLLNLKRGLQADQQNQPPSAVTWRSRRDPRALGTAGTPGVERVWIGVWSRIQECEHGVQGHDPIRVSDPPPAHARVFCQTGVSNYPTHPTLLSHPSHPDPTAGRWITVFSTHTPHSDPSLHILIAQRMPEGQRRMAVLPLPHPAGPASSLCPPPLQEGQGGRRGLGAPSLSPGGSIGDPDPPSSRTSQTLARCEEWWLCGMSTPDRNLMP